MWDAKPISAPLAIHFKIPKEMCPKTQEEIDYMSKDPYSSAIGSVMYAMVHTRPNNEHETRVVSKYMNNLDKEN